MSNADFKAALALADEWGKGGWIEYVLWDIIQGYREKPMFGMPGLTDEQLALLERLRDDHKIWFSHTKKGWQIVAIDGWRKHTENLRADDVARLLEIYGELPNGL